MKRLVSGVLTDVTTKNRAFFDTDTIRYGEEFDEAIYAGIEQSYFFFLIWMDSYLNSDKTWCARELYHAHKIEGKLKTTLVTKGKFYFIYPILYRGKASDLPICIEKKNVIPLTGLYHQILNSHIRDFAFDENFTNFQEKLYNSIIDNFKLLYANKDAINFTELFAEIEKPDDETLKAWIIEQNSKGKQKEGSKTPNLKMQNE